MRECRWHGCEAPWVDALDVAPDLTNLDIDIPRPTWIEQSDSVEGGKFVNLSVGLCRTHLDAVAELRRSAAMPDA